MIPVVAAVYLAGMVTAIVLLYSKRSDILELSEKPHLYKPRSEKAVAVCFAVAIFFIVAIWPIGFIGAILRKLKKSI